MKKILLLQRILASLIDLMVVYLPCQFLVFVLFSNLESAHIWLPAFLFIL